MIAPIQLGDFTLHTLHFEENPDFDAPDDLGAVLRVFVGGDLLQETPPDPDSDPDDVPVLLDLDVTTELVPHDLPSPHGDGAEAFQAFLSVGVNTTDDTAGRAPFTAWVDCSGLISAAALPKKGKARQTALRVVRANSAGMLYGMARHTLLLVTRSSRSVNLLLPSLSFQQIVEHEIGREAQDDDA